MQARRRRARLATTQRYVTAKQCTPCCVRRHRVTYSLKPRFASLANRCHRFQLQLVVDCSSSPRSSY